MSMANEAHRKGEKRVKKRGLLCFLRPVLKLSFCCLIASNFRDPVIDVIQNDYGPLDPDFRQTRGTTPRTATTTKKSTADKDYKGNDLQNIPRIDNHSLNNGSGDGYSKNNFTHTNSSSDMDTTDYQNNYTLPKNTTLKDSRPWMIVHVGPPKTGTTTIQYGLSSDVVATRLAAWDNIWYVGQVMQDARYIPIPNQTKGLTMFPMKDFLWRKKPSFDFIDALREHRDAGHNVVISAEHYTKDMPRIEQFFDWTLLREGKSRNRVDSFGLNTKSNTVEAKKGSDNDSEPLLGFRVKIVVGYRRFFQWLVSYHHQVFHDCCSRQQNRNSTIPGVVEYIEDYLYGEVITNITDPLTNERKNPKHLRKTDATLFERLSGSLYAYKKWSTSKPELYDRVDVIDLHQQQVGTTTKSNSSSNEDHGLFTNFVCQILPSANNTCNYLKQQPSMQKVKFNTRSTGGKNIESFSQIDLSRIVQEGLFRKYLPYIDGSNYQDVHNRIKEWHSTNHRLPRKICASHDTLETLRSQSLLHLRSVAELVRDHSLSRKKSNPKLAQDLFGSSAAPRHHLLLSREYGEIDNLTAWWEPIQKRHDKAFAKDVARKQFCQTDVDKVFESKRFIRFVFGDKGGKKKL